MTSRQIATFLILVCTPWNYWDWSWVNYTLQQTMALNLESTKKTIVDLEPRELVNEKGTSYVMQPKFGSDHFVPPLPSIYITCRPTWPELSLALRPIPSICPWVSEDDAYQAY